MTLVIESRLEALYDQFQQNVRRFRQHIVTDQATMAAGAINSDRIVNLDLMLGRDRDRFNAFVAIPGIVQYVKDERDDQLYDVSVEVASLATAIGEAITEIETSFPESGGYKLYLQLSNGVAVLRSFPTGGTATLRTKLQAIIDLIQVL